MTAARAHATSLWHQLKNDQPGKRFQNLHETRRKGCDAKFCAQRWINLGVGLLVFALGLVLLVAPGPGLLIVALGLALVASESQWVATMLDTAEVRVRSWVGGREERSAEVRSRVGRPN